MNVCVICLPPLYTHHGHSLYTHFSRILAYVEFMELAIQLQEAYKGHYSKENLAFLENLKGGDGPCLTLAGRDQVREDRK